MELRSPFLKDVTPLHRFIGTGRFENTSLSDTSHPCGDVTSNKNGDLNMEYICTRNVLSVCVGVVPLYLLTSILVDCITPHII